ncbi:MAG: DUF4157 domain-containing protein, partial [Myxococcales bacterium]|nr:DUF4157 domain-containing protein [Myxococcales bacterium]
MAVTWDSALSLDFAGDMTGPPGGQLGLGTVATPIDATLAFDNVDSDAALPPPPADAPDPTSILAAVRDQHDLLHGDLIPSLHAAAEEDPQSPIGRRLGADIRELASRLDLLLAQAGYAVSAATESVAADGTVAAGDHAHTLAELTDLIAGNRHAVERALAVAPPARPEDMRDPHAAEALEAQLDAGQMPDQIVPAGAAARADGSALDRPATYEESRATLAAHRVRPKHEAVVAADPTGAMARANGTALDRPATYDEPRSTLTPRRPDPTGESVAATDPAGSRGRADGTALDRPATYDDTRATLDAHRPHPALGPVVATAPADAAARASGIALDRPAIYDESRDTLDVRRGRRHREPVVAADPAGAAARASGTALDRPAAYDESRDTLDLLGGRSPGRPVVVKDAAPSQEAPTQQPLPHRAAMESMFGEDFSAVRVQTGAHELHEAGAEAAAHGESITFATRDPDPSLVAHELTHVVQGRRANTTALAFSRAASSPDDAAELEAESIAAQVAAHGPAAGSVSVQAPPAARVHYARSPATTTAQPATPTRPAASPRAIDRASELSQVALQHLAALQSTFVPAWRQAVSAMSTAAAAEIAGHIVGGLSHIRDAQRRVAELVPDVAPKAPQVSTAETDVHTDPVDLFALTQLKAQLDIALAGGLPNLAIEMSPQMFDGASVAGAVEAPPRVPELAGYVAFEANNVVSLLSDADYIEKFCVMPSDGDGRSVPAQPDQLREAVDRLERTRGRPANFAFLAAVLRKRGLWQQIESISSINGNTPGALERKVGAQAKETGTTADVGAWDADAARDALTYGVTDWAVTDGDGTQVTDMLASADPGARGELVMQLVRMGLLDRWADNVPYGHVQMIAESLDDPQAESMLAPYWEDEGGVPSAGQWMTDKAVEQWEKGNYVRSGGIVTLNKLLDVFTFGGKPAIDSAHEARDAGLISSDAYWTQVAKASTRTLAVGAASAWTGGLAGSWSEGAALGLGAGEGGAGVLGAGMGGAVGNVGGMFAGDVYDQILNGKDGFNSIGDYGQAFAEGGLAGTLTAGLSMTAARFLPKSAQNMAQAYAESHPSMLKVLDAGRRSGYAASVRVRMTVSEVREMVRNLGGGGGGGFGGGMQPALAGAGAGGGAAAASEGALADVSSLPPDADVWVTVRPLVDLAAPAAARLGDESDVFEVESVEPAEPLFDDYGDGASYQDEPMEWAKQGYDDDDVGFSGDEHALPAELEG